MALNHARHIAAGQIVGFQAARGDAGVRIGADAGLHGHDFGLHDDARVDLPQAHSHQGQQADPGVGHVRLKPQLAIGENQKQKNEEEKRHQRRRQHTDQYCRANDRVAQTGGWRNA